MVSLPSFQLFQIWWTTFQMSWIWRSVKLIFTSLRLRIKGYAPTNLSKRCFSLKDLLMVANMNFKLIIMTGNFQEVNIELFHWKKNCPKTVQKLLGWTYLGLKFEFWQNDSRSGEFGSYSRGPVDLCVCVCQLSTLHLTVFITCCL